MARAYSLDLRRRVIEAIAGGLSTREAARRFAIGIATAGAWYRRWLRTGDMRPGRQGGREGSRLDPHEAFILDLVEARKDITLVEIAARLEAERGMRTCPSSLCAFFKKRGITFKKSRHMLQSRTGPTSGWRARHGSRVNSISIRAA
jgi:transposase